jgi:hypothetical protein
LNETELIRSENKILRLSHSIVIIIFVCHINCSFLFYLFLFTYIL